ncbi:MAG: MarR family transcriptional regulator [Candidatus Saganbacteria bacterium]|nr:MarR family transcriptional regulator [Candidatus Saganbacteria bacterium]
MNTGELNDFIEKFESCMSVITKGFHGGGFSEINDIDITIPQFVALNIIAKKECPKMSDLSAELGVTLGNMTMMIDRLIKEDFVERKGDPEDRRIVRVCLNQKGKNLIKKAKEHKMDSMARIFGKMSEGDRKSLLHIIEKLTGAIRQEQERG